MDCRLTLLSIFLYHKWIQNSCPESLQVTSKNLNVEGINLEIGWCEDVNWIHLGQVGSYIWCCNSGLHESGTFREITERLTEPEICCFFFFNFRVLHVSFRRWERIGRKTSGGADGPFFFIQFQFALYLRTLNLSNDNYSHSKHLQLTRLTAHIVISNPRICYKSPIKLFK